MFILLRVYSWTFLPIYIEIMFSRTKAKDKLAPFFATRCIYI